MEVLDSSPISGIRARYEEGQIFSYGGEAMDQHTSGYFNCHPGGGIRNS